MIRRHRYAIVLVCIAALAMALALPDVGATIVCLGTPVATIVPAPSARTRVVEHEHRASSVAGHSTLAPRAPPLA